MINKFILIYFDAIIKIFICKNSLSNCISFKLLFSTINIIVLVTQNLVEIFLSFLKKVEDATCFLRNHKYKANFLFGKTYGLHSFFLKCKTSKAIDSIVYLLACPQGYFSKYKTN